MCGKIRSAVTALVEPAARVSVSSIRREIPSDPPVGTRGLVDPSQKLRTTSHLMNLISGRAVGQIETINPSEYDSGTDISADAEDFEERLSNLLSRPYAVDPAQLGRYVESLATRAQVARSSSEKSESGDTDPTPPTPEPNPGPSPTE